MRDLYEEKKCFANSWYKVYRSLIKGYEPNLN